MERFESLLNPGAAASCDFSLLIQCSANLEAPQGSAFGFPNPLLGLAGWIAPIVVGVALLAGARFARWFWWLFALGMTGAMAFVIWLIGQSIYVLGTLCPWCMVTWAVTIPAFVTSWLHLLRSGMISDSARARSMGQTLMRWSPVIIIAGYFVIVFLAQIQLEFINNILQTI